MNIDVKLFAAARQAAGKDFVSIQLPDSATVADLRRGLAEQIPMLAEILPHVLIAVDSNYTEDTAIVQPGQEIACIPPVSGG